MSSFGALVFHPIPCSAEDKQAEVIDETQWSNVEMWPERRSTDGTS